MAIVPPDYEPSPDEEFMNPPRVAHFRKKLLRARADLRTKLAAVPHVEPDEAARDGDQADHASAETERKFDTLNRVGIQSLPH
jgi:DnaK suppressor protein